VLAYVRLEVYIWFVQLTATDFRKNMFQALERALQGEAVEITYKGAKLRLAPPPDQSKLARATRRHALLVEPHSIVESDSDLMATLTKSWKKDDAKL
jgi:antitoxin (DNA-binding transcriptional repressor) of toxin-antitoxin stability system